MWVSKIERLIAWLLVLSDIFLEHVMLGGVYWRNGVSRTASIIGVSMPWCSKVSVAGY
jgi:hypothetical protein